MHTACSLVNWSNPFRKQFGKINQGLYNGCTLDLVITSAGLYLEEIISKYVKDYMHGDNMY